MYGMVAAGLLIIYGLPDDVRCAVASGLYCGADHCFRKHGSG